MEDDISAKTNMTICQELRNCPHSFQTSFGAWLSPSNVLGRNTVLPPVIYADFPQAASQGIGPCGQTHRPARLGQVPAGEDKGRGCSLGDAPGWSSRREDTQPSPLGEGSHAPRWRGRPGTQRHLQRRRPSGRRIDRWWPVSPGLAGRPAASASKQGVLLGTHCLILTQVLLADDDDQVALRGEGSTAPLRDQQPPCSPPAPGGSSPSGPAARTQRSRFSARALPGPSLRPQGSWLLHGSGASTRTAVGPCREGEGGRSTQTPRAPSPRTRELASNG